LKFDVYFLLEAKIQIINLLRDIKIFMALRLL